MSLDQASQTEIRTARRRLLRGSVSVPAIMTLSSGAALANSSTLRCFNNAAGQPDPTTTAVVGLERYALTDKGKTTYAILRTEFNTAAQINGFATTPGFVETGTSNYIGMDGKAFVGTPQKDGGKVGLKFTYNPSNAPGARFTVAGLYTTAGSNNLSGGSGTAMFASCWTSVAPFK